ncbi:MAG: hypothetical protein V1777_02190 [Candidatus Micrarchaeota archaeon]
MVKVVLAWNPDLNESAVTLPLILRTSELLRSHGQAVKVVKVPFSLTLHSQLKADGPVPAMGVKQVLWLREKFPDAVIFQFHTTPDTSDYWRKKIAGEKPERLPDFWVRREQALRGIVGIGVIPLSKQMYFIEFPAKYAAAHPNLRKMARGRMDELNYLWFGNYFRHQAKREASEKAGYLSNAFAKAAAKKIEKAISANTPLTEQRPLRPKQRKKSFNEKRLRRRGPR